MIKFLVRGTSQGGPGFGANEKTYPKMYLFRYVFCSGFFFASKHGLRESCNSVSTCNLVTETELQLLFIGMINSERVNNVTS
jgi:hypothetical protein